MDAQSDNMTNSNLEDWNVFGNKGVLGFEQAWFLDGWIAKFHFCWDGLCYNIRVVFFSWVMCSSLLGQTFLSPSQTPCV